jgi:hypothetical protein
MKNIFKKLGNKAASFATRMEKHKDRQQQPITLYMIATELENDLTALRSRFVKAITKVFGTIRK